MAHIDLKICCGMNCCSHGGQELINLIENDAMLMKQCDLEVVECIGCCGENGASSPVVQINGKCYPQMTPQKLLDMLITLSQ